MASLNLLRVYLDADVLFRAGTAAHERTASLVVLRLGMNTLIDLVTARHAADEVVRNLPPQPSQRRLELIRMLGTLVRILDNPPAWQVNQLVGRAHPKDIVNLAAAVEADASLLLTFNGRDYYQPPPSLHVSTPGEFVASVRSVLYVHWTQRRDAL